MKKIQAIKQRLNSTTPGDWKFVANIPFYVNVRKPAPSMSKHDNKRPTYWRYEDGVFVACAKHDVQYLLDKLEEAIKAITYYAEDPSRNESDFQKVGKAFLKKLEDE